MKPYLVLIEDGKYLNPNAIAEMRAMHDYGEYKSAINFVGGSNQNYKISVEEINAKIEKWMSDWGKS